MIGPGQELAAQQGPGGEFPPITRSPRRRVMAAGPSRAGSSAGSTSRTPPSWRVLAARRPCCPGRPAAKLGVLAVNAGQARGRQAASDFPASARRYTRAVVNKVTLRLAGHLAFADLEHVGRKSGTVRHTPVRALRSGNTVIAGLNFARQSDWYQNIQAAGTCRMRLGGEQLTLGAPTLVPAARGVTDLPWLFRFALRHLVHTANYVQLPILQAPPRAQASAPGEHSGGGARPASGRCPPGSCRTTMRSPRRPAGTAPAASRMRAAPDPRILTGWSGASPHVLRFPPRAFLRFPVCPPGSPLRPPSSGFPSSGVLRFVPFGRRPGSGSPSVSLQVPFP